MTNCCNISETSLATNKSALCPVNGRHYKKVKLKTILHHIKHPWARQLPEQTYYYCDDPACELVYFAEDKTEIYASELRLSTEERNNTICYCFGISKNDLKENKADCKAFVVEQIQQSHCDCQTRNPSGKCCLKNFTTPHL